MSTLHKAALVLGFSAFLFVVVCPLTVTPTAVTKVPAALVALIAIPILTLPEPLRFVPAAWERPEFASEPRLDALCTRLC